MGRNGHTDFGPSPLGLTRKARKFQIRKEQFPESSKYDETGLSEKHPFLSPPLHRRNLRGIVRAVRFRRARGSMHQIFDLILRGEELGQQISSGLASLQSRGRSL